MLAGRHGHLKLSPATYSNPGFGLPDFRLMNAPSSSFAIIRRTLRVLLPPEPFVPNKSSFTFSRCRKWTAKEPALAVLSRLGRSGTSKGVRTEFATSAFCRRSVGDRFNYSREGFMNRVCTFER